MSVLSHLEPGKVFRIFEEICAIPHGSGNIRQVSNYCANFAKERGLEYIQDGMGNVIIFVPAAPGYEKAEPVILQGHMDMVCVKTADCPLDMEKDGLKLAVEGDFVYAEGTSLGADNGIAVAMALALADSPEVPKPALELLITVDEEIGLLGAAGVDMSPMKGRKLVNLDSEEEGVFTVSCAGGVRTTCMLDVRRESCGWDSCRVSVEGLLGGHSGVEIHTGRGNANKLLGRVLARAQELTEVRLISMYGGVADNVITKEAQAVLAARDIQAVAAAAAELDGLFRQEFAQTDPGVKVVFEAMAPAAEAVCAEDTGRVIRLLEQLPQGVQSMSKNIEGLVQTSLNMGQLELKDGLWMRFALRSSVLEEKQQMLDTIVGLFDAEGGKVETDGDYPAWEYREDSPLRDLFVQVYTDQYGAAPKVDAIHAGLECGMLSGKCPGLDCISLGPDLHAVHSVEEKLSVSSTARVWALVCEVLKRSK